MAAVKVVFPESRGTVARIEVEYFIMGFDMFPLQCLVGMHSVAAQQQEPTKTGSHPDPSQGEPVLASLEKEAAGGEKNIPHSAYGP